MDFFYSFVDGTYYATAIRVVKPGRGCMDAIFQFFPMLNDNKKGKRQ